MRYICVYLGANFGTNSHFKSEIIKLGTEIADLGCHLVYGGSSLGMMGLLASTVKKMGGKVTGVITKHLIDKEIPLTILDDLRIVDTMQERKKLMQEMSDSFIVMPGGLGTLEEAIETWNAIKIGEINKKIAFLNIDNFFDKLFEFTSSCEKNGFISKEQGAIPIITSDITILMKKLMIKTETAIKEEKPSTCTLL